MKLKKTIFLITSSVFVLLIIFVVHHGNVQRQNQINYMKSDRFTTRFYEVSGLKHDVVNGHSLTSNDSGEQSFYVNNSSGKFSGNAFFCTDVPNSKFEYGYIKDGIKSGVWVVINRKGEVLKENNYE